MSDWKPYAVQATLGTMKLLVQSCSRGYRWRLSTHSTPGTKGDLKRKHGRESIVDQVQVLLTVPEVDQFVQLADREAPLSWNHPLLQPITGHVENLDLPAETNIYGYFRASFQVVQAYEPNAVSQTQPGVTTATSQAKASSLFNDLLDGLDEIPDGDIPTNNAGTAFTTAAGDLGEAFGAMDSVFDTIVDPVGDGTWRDLSRSMDTFVTAADAFVEATREIEDSLGSLAYEFERIPSLITETIGEAIETLKTPEGIIASFITQNPSDLFSMMAEAGMEVTEENIVALMEDNGITDPFNIAPGLTISIPVAA